MDTNETLAKLRKATERAKAEDRPDFATAYMQEVLEYAEALDAAMLDGAPIPADWLSGRLTLSTRQIRNGDGYLTDAEWLKL